MKPVILLDAGNLVGLSGSNAGDVLTWNGSEWLAQAGGGGGGSGTVTSITAGTGLDGGTITVSGTISMPNVGTPVTGYGSASKTVTLSTDAQGRVSSATQQDIAIAQSQVDGLVTDLSGKVPTTRTISTTSGQLTGGGALSGNLTLGLATAGTSGDYGSASSVPVIHTDAYGRVTSATSTTIDIATSQVSGLDTALAGKALKTTTISSGTGILVTGGGTLADNNTISLASGVVTAATKGSASKSATVTVDTYGRTTSLSDQDIAIAASQVTSGQISLVRGGTGIDASGVTAGELLVGATGGGALALQTVSQDATLASTGAVTVKGLQTVPVAATAPASGQVLQYNGTNWTPGVIPTGGSGGGGITYYFDYGTTTGISPTTGLPQTPVATSLLGRSHVANETPLTSADLVNGTPSLICGFVTAVTDPSVTDVPAGLWDFNIWASAPSSQSAGQTSIQARVYRYRSSDSTYLELGRSDLVYLYDLGTRAQYILSVTMAQATILATDRIYIEVWAQKAVSNTRRVMLYFQADSPSHVHTTLPSVAGTGLVHVINGVFQSPASPADLASSDVTGTLLVANGGTGAATLPIHQVLLGNGTSAIDSVSLAVGQVLVGTTSNSPSAATIGSGTGVTVSSSSGAISIAIGQAVGTGSSVTFGDITDSGLTASQYVKTDGSKKLVSSSTIAAGDLSGTVAVANGGTGLSTLTLGNLYLGNGASSPTALAGTLAGDYVKWSGSDWTSAALSSDAVTSLTGTSGQITVSASVGSVSLSLPNVGTARTGYGSASKTVTITTDAQGRVSALTENTISITSSQVSDLSSNAVTSLAAGTGVGVSASTGAVTVSIGQSVATSASPTFAGLTLSNFNVAGVVKNSAAGVLSGGNSVSLTADVSGILPVTNGGTGASTLPTNGAILVGLGTSIGQLVGTTSGDIAVWNGGALGWVSTNKLAVANGGTNLTSYAVGDILYASATTTLAKRGIGSTGNVLTVVAGVPQWSAPATSGTVTSVSSSTTLSGLSLTTTDGSSTPAIALTGTLGVANGGTGATTLTGYVKGSGTPALTASSTIPASDISGLSGTYAPLASPSFTGTPSLPTGTTGVTQSAGNNTTALATTAFVTAAVAASSGAPYDVSGEAAGTLANGDEIWHFKATRAFTLSATAANHLAGAVTAPSGTCVITLYKNTTGTQVFTITYTASATGVIGSVTNNTVAQGDLLFAKITSGPSTISNPYWTFYGTL